MPPLVPVLLARRREEEEEKGRDFQSGGKRIVGKALEGKGPKNGVETGWPPGELGENKSGGLLRRAVRDGCYEFDCPPAGLVSLSLSPSSLLPSSTPVSPCPPILAFGISPPPRFSNPSRAPGGARWQRETSPNKVERRARGWGGWVASIFRSLHLRLSGTTQVVARGENLFDDRSQTGPLALRAMHRYAGRIKEIGDTRPRQHDP